MEDGVSIVRKGFGGFGEEKGENRKLQFKRNCEVACVSISFSNNDHHLHVAVYLTALSDIQYLTFKVSFSCLKRGKLGRFGRACSVRKRS